MRIVVHGGRISRGLHAGGSIKLVLLFFILFFVLYLCIVQLKTIILKKRG